MRLRFIGICQSILLSLLSGHLLADFSVTEAQTFPPCAERPTVIENPWVDINRWCPEEVIADKTAGEMAFVRLAVGTDGTLYATRPLTGQVLALVDTDQDGLPDTPQVVAENLTLPNGLAYYADSLYISGGPYIYRLIDDMLEILVDDLPYGGGFWTGGLAIGPDERLYVAIGAACDFCEPDDPERGAILSFALDGSDRQLVASGLRNPSDITWYQGNLWTLDTTRDSLAGQSNMDELNRVTPGVHFGWPYCAGSDNQADFIGTDFDCTQAVPPAFSFPNQSKPISLTSYTSSTFPDLADTLLVVLTGSHNTVELTGYRVVAVTFDSAGEPTDTLVLMPAANKKSKRKKMDPAMLNYRGLGFWPHHPYDLAVSPEGWIYISSGGGYIWVLRPL